MRKAFKHTGVLMMVAVIGLAVAGAAYALWFEDLHLTATVNTGTFNVDWSCDTQSGDAAADNCTNSAVPVVYTYNCPAGTQGCPADHPQSTLVGSDIPSGKAPACSAAISDQTGPHEANDAADNNLLTLTLGGTSGTGIYPFAGCRFYIDVHSSGSVPAHFERTISCTGPDNTHTCGNDLTLVVSGGQWFGNAANVQGLPDATAACQALLGHFQNSGEVSVNDTPLQLHQSYHLGCVIELTAKESAKEGATYTWTATVQGHQWNEGGNLQ